MTKHIAIVGAGIIGVSAAAFLQRAGFRVTLIDRVGPGEGCSFGNAGGIAFAEVMPTIHPNMLIKLPGWLLDPLGPLSIRWSYLPNALPWFLAASRNAMPNRVKEIAASRAALGLRAVADFETLLKASGEHDLMVYRETLRVFDTEKQFIAEADERALKAQHGFPVDIFSGNEAREMEAALSLHITKAATAGGWYFVRNPERVVKSIATEVMRNGGSVIQDDVLGFDIEDQRISAVTLAGRGALAIDHVVICAGAWSHLLAKKLGDKVLLEAERGYHMVLPNAGVSISRSITYARTPGAATPMDMGLRLAGTDEFAGLDAAPNYQRADKLWSLFKKIFPKLQSPDEATTRWMGRRPGTPDSLPVIGPSQHISNVTYGFGHGHMGLTWGPTTGRLIAEMISGQKTNMDLTPFRVSRF